MPEVISTRQWEKDRLAELVVKVIKRFSSNAAGQVNLGADGAQKSLAVAVIEKLEEEGHLS